WHAVSALSSSFPSGSRSRALENNALLQQFLADTVSLCPVLGSLGLCTCRNLRLNSSSVDAFSASLQKRLWIGLQQTQASAQSLEQARHFGRLAAIDFSSQLEKHGHRFGRAKVFIHRSL